jgi:hypothetical protein
VCVVIARFQDDNYLWSLAVGRWKGKHAHWEDFVVIQADGSFYRPKNGDRGSWVISRRSGLVILGLTWDDWGLAELQVEDESLIGTGRHSFKNHFQDFTKFTLSECDTEYEAPRL